MATNFWVVFISHTNCNFTEIVLLLSQSLGYLWLIQTGHFTVTGGSEAGGGLDLIQTFLLYYVNQVRLMLTSIFQEQCP